MNRLDKKDIELAQRSLQTAQNKGADQVRITLTKSVADIVDTLNGEVDKVTHNLNKSFSICLFVNGRYGSFSTNRLSQEDIDSFIDKAIDIVKTVEPDPCRQLPDQSRIARNALTGVELGLFDNSYDSVAEDERLQKALETSIFKSTEDGNEWKLISEETEYSDSIIDIITIDTNGTFCRHSETSFDFYAGITVEDNENHKFSGYWWDSSPFKEKLNISSCIPTALEKAVRQIGPKPIAGGKHTMVLSNICSSKMVSPILNALNAYSIQQNNSFLLDSIGKQVFPEGLTISDESQSYGQGGCRLFDSEGVGTVVDNIIERGIVKKYFINTYMAGKLNMDPTIEDATRPYVHPWPDKGMDLQQIMEQCSDGILVTGFNGGNSNSVTGDFSYGIEGFVFKNGIIVHPIREMLVTGNFLTLWSNLITAGNDCLKGTQKQIPTLAFSNVDFSA